MLDINRKIHELWEYVILLSETHPWLRDCYIWGPEFNDGKPGVYLFGMPMDTQLSEVFLKSKELGVQFHIYDIEDRPTSYAKCDGAPQLISKVYSAVAARVRQRTADIIASTPNPVKQVIIMRTDLNMRKGKMIAQGSHASMAFLTKRFREIKDEKYEASVAGYDTTAIEEWVEGNFTKICLQVDSESKLQELYDQAAAAGLTVSKIVDSGLTEFNNQPTFTCIAIGPNYSSQIDKITKELKLL